MRSAFRISVIILSAAGTRVAKKRRPSKRGGRSSLKRKVRVSADVTDAFLLARLVLVSRLGRQLQHGCLLALAQQRQQNAAPVREFNRIVMRGHLVLVHLAKDGRLVVDRLGLPAQ